MTDYQDIKIELELATTWLEELYGIKGHLKPLPGYVDFNFKVDDDKGASYILKISRPEPDLKDLSFQQALIGHLESSARQQTPKLIRSKSGETLLMKEHKGKRSIRLLTWVEGRLWSDVNPIKPDLLESLGQVAGGLSKSLSSFDDPAALRDFEWDLAQSSWTIEHRGLFEGEQASIVTYFQDRFQLGQPAYGQLRRQIVHNDVNDNNIIVSEDLMNPKVKSIIDFGDAVHTQLINDVAICCTYVIMGFPNPLAAISPILKGYHAVYPLLEEELEHLYTAIGMRLVTSLTKSAINKLEEPENEYLQVSDKAGWTLLRKWYQINPDFAHYSFRLACGFPAHPQSHLFAAWAKSQQCTLSQLFPTIGRQQAHLLDLSVSSTWLGHQYEFNNLDLFQFRIEQLQKIVPEKILAGGYLEPRPLYTSGTYGREGNSGMEDRTIHLGIDFWLPSGTRVHTPWEGEVIICTNDAGEKEYGGLVVLKHDLDGLVFYSLYGHLHPESIMANPLGSNLQQGAEIGVLGDYPENGNWAPHLHFQLMHSLLGYATDFPGVAYPSERELWAGICPDPNLLLKLDALMVEHDPDRSELVDYRKEHLGKSLSLQYDVPLEMVRGAGVYLMDRLGRKYLDTVNNVAHVGHEHPEVVAAGKAQMNLINTNTRYLHPSINQLAETLLETLPEELSVLHFVNSGSEANELAIRMAYASGGGTDVIASEVGYHGNTNQCVAMSSYKFDGKGGKGKPEHTAIFPMPDAFRGKYRGPDTGTKYAGEVKDCINQIEEKGRKAAALIVEPIISCGGQVELPDGFLDQAYSFARKAGAVCISDEVQTGCGRMGSVFWGFQLYDVVPDIVTIGKPLGNGHPVAAVACTKEVAEAFANGMEYFNTFGGNPVSCTIANSVLTVVKEEGLQQNALEVGNYLKDGLKVLQKDYPIIGDVRGKGLFLGFELVDARLSPLSAQAKYLANRMKEHGILMSTDGPDNNVLKIKPPMVFNKSQADLLLKYLRKILAEDFMTHH